MTAPLLVTRDQSLLDELLRLAAAAGVAPDVAADGGAALRGWAAAPVVLVGVDAAEDLARLAPARRPRVHVVAWGAVPDDLFRVALAVGAESVARLPRSEAWLAELLTDLGEGEPRPRACWSGWSAAAAAPARRRSRARSARSPPAAGRALVVDADPLGPGVDRVLGLEERDGVRWDALCDTTGRLSARALREALPRRDGLGCADLARRAARHPAGVRGPRGALGGPPRPRPGGGRPAAHRRTRWSTRSPRGATGCSSSWCRPSRASPRRRGSARRHPDPTTVRLVLRGTGRRRRRRSPGPPASRCSPTMADQRGLAEAIDLGLGPVRSRRGPLGRAAAEVLDQLVLLRAVAA